MAKHLPVAAKIAVFAYGTSATGKEMSKISIPVLLRSDCVFSDGALPHPATA